MLRTKKYNMELPQSVLTFKLLDGPLVENKDQKLLLPIVNYSQVDVSISQMFLNLLFT